MQLKKKGLILLIAILFIITSMGCSKTEEAKQEKSIPVKTLKIERSSIEQKITLAGSLVAKKEVNVTSEIPGKIREITVEVGQKVEKGDILFNLENDDLKASEEQAEQSLIVAKANLDKVISGARPQEIAQVNQQVKQAEIKRNEAKVNAERMTALYEAQAISEQQFEQAKSQYDLAESAYQSALQQQSLVHEGASEETIRATKAQVGLAEANLKMAKAKLEDTIIRSPINGKIGFIKQDEGEFMMQGTPVVQVIQDNEMTVAINVTENEIALINEKEKVEVKLPAAPNQIFYGTVTEISPVTDMKTKGFPIEITLDNEKGALKSGMTANVLLTLEKKNDALVVPMDAIVEDLGESYLYIYEDGKAVKTRVETGISNGRNIEIIEGLSEKQQVIIKGQTKLSNGDKVIEGGDKNEDS